MSKKKIGIMTFHYAHNYGAMLQAYALKTYLTRIGNHVEIINYVPEYMRVKYFRLNKFQMLCMLKRSVIKAYYKQKRNIHKFDEFEKDYLGVDKKTIVSKQNLKELSQKFDLVVFGSDQIWNTHITFNDKSYFGDFLGSSADKALSYAASCGDAIGTKEFDEAALQYLKYFKAVSVRENNALDFLNKNYHMSTVCVLDPVFLLESVIWKKIAEASKINIDEEYIFYYTIQNNEDLIRDCNNFAKSSNIRVYAAHGEMKQSNPSATLLDGIGPVEFLYLIKNASCVYTNSFHALAFSILFNKKAYIRAHTQTGNRVTDLLHRCGMNWDGEGLFEVDGEDCGINLQDAIDKSKKFLERNLYLI